MLLVVDVGNTNIVFGVYENKELIHHWRIQTDRHATEDEYAMLIQQLLHYEGIRLAQITGVILASVVPPLVTVLVKLSKKYLHIEPVVLGAGVKTGLNIQTENPREVGADRIANAVAGIEKYGAPLIIVDFGTATTFCCIDDQSRYLGGAITPGISISAEALYQRAAKLTRVELVKPEQVIGKNTVQSMQSGIYFGYVGLVDGIVKRMKKEFVKGEPKVIATGGLAALIGAQSEMIDEVDPLLTLEGLHLIYKRNQRK